MDELVKQVTSKTGISEDQAKQAIETVLNFLQDKLPDPIAKQIKAAVEGGELPAVGDLGDKLGGLLGK